MSYNVTLPHGGTAQFRDAAEVTERQRRPVTRLQLQLSGSAVGQVLRRKAEADEAKDGSFTDEDYKREVDAIVGQDPSSLELLVELNDAIAACLCESVTLPNGTTRNVTADTLLDLPARVLDDVKAEAAKRQGDLMPDFGVSADPESPTPLSAA